MRSKLFIALSIIYFLIALVLGYLAYDFVLRNPLIGMLVAAIGATFIIYHNRRFLYNFEQFPPSILAVMSFLGLLFFWPLCIAAVLCLGTIYLYYHLLMKHFLKMRWTGNIYYNDYSIYNRYNRLRDTESSSIKKPWEFLEEVRRIRRGAK
ncbi:MAG: hypothetical protein RMH75_07185 [Archaeoglobaceae archaeon]|nr:hypothetical protein [Archaeoglobaceae archaeon]